MEVANLLAEIGLPPTETPTLLIDNQSAIHLTTRPGFQRKTKHIPIRYHYLKELVTENKIVIKYIPGADNPADILSKPVTQAQFKKHIHKLVTEVSNPSSTSN